MLDVPQHAFVKSAMDISNFESRETFFYMHLTRFFIVVNIPPSQWYPPSINADLNLRVIDLKTANSTLDLIRLKT